MCVTFNAPVPRTIIHFFQIFKKDSELLPSKHIKVETTLITNVHNRCFNVGIRLKRKVSQRMFIGVEKAALRKQRFARKDSIIKQN